MKIHTNGKTIQLSQIIKRNDNEKGINTLNVIITKNSLKKNYFSKKESFLSLKHKEDEYETKKDTGDTYFIV